MNIDTSFYGRIKPYKLLKLTKVIEDTYPELYHSNNIEKDIVIKSCSTIEKANETNLVFVDNTKYIKYLKKSEAGCFIIDPKYISHISDKHQFIFSKMPRRIFAFCLNLISPGNYTPTAKSNISKKSIIKQGVVIGKNTYIGKNVSIGENTVIGNSVIIEDNTQIGSNCSIDYAKIGKNSVIYPGVRIGTTGFGFNFDDKGVYKFPHRGRVIIKDNVEIGANSAIDRGSLGDTIINDFVMIDNLVHIAHNVNIGKGTVICGQSGIAGSTIIGENVVIAAQVGIAGHLNIKSGSIISARSGVTKNITKSEMFGGFPALPIKEFRKQKATLKILTKQLNKKNKT